MSFTNQALGTLGSLAAVSTMSQSVSEQKKANAAKNAEDEQIVKSTKTAIRNDTIEAATAIKAHEGKEEKFIKTFEGIDFDKLGELDEKGIEDLAKRVDTYRSGKMTDDRIEKMNKAGDKYQKYHDNPIDRIYKTGDNLKKAYESFRELNQRIDASRQLKFNLEAAQARLKARGVK